MQLQGIPWLQRWLNSSVILSALMCVGCSESTDELLTDLKDGDSVSRRKAAQELSSVASGEQSAAIDGLRASAVTGDDETRRLSVYAIGELGDAARDAMPTLIQALQDSDDRVRWAAAHAIVRVDPSELAAINVLQHAIQNGDLRAVLSLGDTQGEAATQATLVLTSVLNNSRSLIRLKAVQSLSKIGPSAKSALPALQRALRDSSLDVREAAQLAISRIDVSNR